MLKLLKWTLNGIILYLRFRTADCLIPIPYPIALFILLYLEATSKKYHKYADYYSIATLLACNFDELLSTNIKEHNTLGQQGLIELPFWRWFGISLFLPIISLIILICLWDNEKVQTSKW